MGILFPLVWYDLYFYFGVLHLHNILSLFLQFFRCENSVIIELLRDESDL